MQQSNVRASHIKRSGSTWSFNVCREMGAHVARSSKRKLFSDYRGDTDLIIRDLSKTDRQDNTRTVAVIKSHSPGIKTRNWAGQGKIKNICTIRDPRDCFASYERFWPKENGESIESRIEDFRSWLELADGFSNDGYSLLIRYEDMIANSLEQIRRISDYLGIRCSEDLLKEIATSTGVEAGQAIIDRMVAGKSGNERVFNPVTQLHENHLNGGEIGRWRNDLPAEIQEKVHTAFLPWLIKFGYVDGDESGNNPSSFDAKFAKKSPQSVKRDHRPGRLPVSCQCCRSPADWFGATDFSKSCEDHKKKVFAERDIEVDYYRCNSCGFLFTPFINDWSAERLKREIYNDDYLQVDPDYVSLRPKNNAELISRLFGQHRQSLALLDYGGGSGELARQLRLSGFVGAKSYDPFYDTDERPLGRFDVVTAFEVIEHVPEPHTVFGTVASLLKEDSLFLFSTLLQPKDIEKVGVGWWYVAPRNGHVSLHTFTSLKIVAAQYGLKFGRISQGLHVACKEIPEFAAQSFKTKKAS